jgi:hypothetical protein
LRIILKKNKRNKRAQTQQVFIYILAILIVGAVLLFGYKSINKIMHQSCDVDQATFKTQLKQTIEQSNNYGDSARKTIKAPCEYDRLCFINKTADVNELSKYPSIKQEYAAGTGNNIFLVSSSKTMALYEVDSVVVDGSPQKSGVLCLNSTGGLFYIKLDGIGKGKVSISADNG